MAGDDMGAMQERPSGLWRGALASAGALLATLLLVGSFLALILAYLGLRARKRGGGSVMEDLADYS